LSVERGADCLHIVQLMPLHPQTPSSLASFKSRLVLPFWYRLTRVVQPLNGCSVVVGINIRVPSAPTTNRGKAHFDVCAAGAENLRVTPLTERARERDTEGCGGRQGVGGGHFSAITDTRCHMCHRTLAHTHTPARHTSALLHLRQRHSQREARPLLLLLLLLLPFNRLFFMTTRVSRCQKGKTSLDLNEARDYGVLGCSGISWTICKQSAPRSRQITTPTPRHSFCTGRVLFLAPKH